MEWLLDAAGEKPNSPCFAAGRPVVLRYSMKEIEKAFQRFVTASCRLMAGNERARRKEAKVSCCSLFTEY